MANRLYLLFQRYNFCSILCFLNVIWGETSVINRKIISTKQLHEIPGFHGRFVQDSYVYDATHCVAGLAFPDRSKELTVFIIRGWDVQVLLGHLSPWRWRSNVPSKGWGTVIQRISVTSQTQILIGRLTQFILKIVLQTQIQWAGGECRAYWCYGRWYEVTTGL